MVKRKWSMEFSTSRIVGFLREHPYSIATGILILYWGFCFSGIRPESAIFGDMIAKWNQVHDVLHKPLGDFSCGYAESIDPEFKFMPGPEYFHAFVQGRCIHFFPFLFAYLIAPAVALSNTYGWFVFNLVLLVAYTCLCIKAARNLLPESNWAPLVAGLSSFIVLPSVYYAFDFSEMMVCLVIGAAFLILMLPDSSGRERTSGAMVAAGMLGGLLFAFRMESIIFVSSLWLSLGIETLRRDNSVSFSGRSLVVGARETIRRFSPHLLAGIATIACVALVQKFFFGSLTGPRGAYHATLVTHSILESHLKIALTLLFGGNLGLFSSLPVISLILLLFVRTIREPHLETCIFLIPVALIPTLLISLTAPTEGGYGWSPRFLSLTLLPYLLLVLLVLFSGHPWFRSRLAVFCYIGILLYSANFVQTGIRIVQRASRQKEMQNKIFDHHQAPVVVIEGESMYGILDERFLRLRVFSGHNPQDCGELVKRLADEKDVTGKPRVAAIMFVASVGANPVSYFPKGWRSDGGETFTTVTVYRFSRQL